MSLFSTIFANEKQFLRESFAIITKLSWENTYVGDEVEPPIVS
ncbi:hypothetical protein ACQY1H_26285 (plasmid) [Agrobacterium vitis]|nr:hypothetical protein [Allorhizobium ampelinum]